MATGKVTAESKSDWQKIAKSHKVEFKSNNVVRYLVEKVAERIGVDDSIVDLDDLKKAVLSKLNEKPVEKKPAAKKTTAKKATKKPAAKKKAAKKPAKKKKAAKKPAPKKKAAAKPKISKEQEEALRLDHIKNVAQDLGVNFGLDQSSSDIVQIVDLYCKMNDVTYVPYGKKVTKKAVDAAVVPPTIEALRAECTEIGVGFNEHHSAEELQNLINMVRGAGAATPITDPSQLNIDAMPNVEGGVATTLPPPDPNHPVVQMGETPSFLEAQVSAPDAVSANKAQMATYKAVFMQTINGHFRLLSVPEINAMFAQANYPFTPSIKANPEQGNQIEIFFKSADCEVRLPNEDKNEWITING
jgi:chemotaxis protein histidine kinase CheA